MLTAGQLLHGAGAAPLITIGTTFLGTHFMELLIQARSFKQLVIKPCSCGYWYIYGFYKGFFDFILLGFYRKCTVFALRP
jgi:hypothetical protein